MISSLKIAKILQLLEQKRTLLITHFIISKTNIMIIQSQFIIQHQFQTIHYLCLKSLVQFFINLSNNNIYIYLCMQNSQFSQFPTLTKAKSSNYQSHNHKKLDQQILKEVGIITKFDQAHQQDRRRYKSKLNTPITPLFLKQYPIEIKRGNIHTTEVKSGQIRVKFIQQQKQIDDNINDYTPSFIKNKNQKESKINKQNLSMQQILHPLYIMKSSSSRNITQHPVRDQNQRSNANFFKKISQINGKQKNKTQKVEDNSIKIVKEFNKQRETFNTESNLQDEIRQLGLEIAKNYQNEYKIKKLEFQNVQRLKVKQKNTVDDFQKIKQLGQGHYGYVYLVRQKKSGFICALKQLPKSKLKQDLNQQQLIRQLKIQFFLNHPNIIKIYGCFSDINNIYLIIQAALGGPLTQFIRKTKLLTEGRSISIMKQVCDSVEYLHSQHIIHRDIKPQNLVLHESVVKLCDFGWSVYLEGNKLRTTFCGTPLYICPEILKGRDYDTKVDIWTLGILIYQLLIGQCPFKITKEQDLTKIIIQQPKIPQKFDLSDNVIDFITKCLNKNPDYRPTIQQLVQHPLFNQYKRRINMNQQRQMFQIV